MDVPGTAPSNDPAMIKHTRGIHPKPVATLTLSLLQTHLDTAIRDYNICSVITRRRVKYFCTPADVAQQ